MRNVPFGSLHPVNLNTFTSIKYAKHSELCRTVLAVVMEIVKKKWQTTQLQTVRMLGSFERAVVIWGGHYERVSFVIIF